MKVKICGMRDPDNLARIIALYPDLLGFIFYPGSKRSVDAQQMAELRPQVPEEIRTVGVFVNENKNKVIELSKTFALSHVQLHGSESPEYCREIQDEGIAVIKCIPMGDSFNEEEIGPYEAFVDYFLFDTQTPDHGGSGKHFDWDLLGSYTLKTPYFLSGGLSAENVSDIQSKNLPGLVGIDANSRLEISPGIKDEDRSRSLIEKVRRTWA